MPDVSGASFEDSSWAGDAIMELSCLMILQQEVGRIY